MIVRETLCTPDIELLSVSLHPFYLPREFPQSFITLVYIHTSLLIKVHQIDVFQFKMYRSLAPEPP